MKDVGVLLNVVHEQVGGCADQEVVAIHVGVQLSGGDGGHALVDVQHDEIAVAPGASDSATAGQNSATAGTHLSMGSVDEDLH